MNTRDTLVTAALRVLEDEGEAGFSTRLVCTKANVTAPTLYHHFGNADGLLSAALAEAFRQFLQEKKVAVTSTDPLVALQEGWDNYVRFAEARPRLYTAMMARVLQAADIPAAKQAYGLLQDRISNVARAGLLVMSEDAAANLIWSSANAAALLHVTASLQLVETILPPDPTVISNLRDSAISAISRRKI